MIQVRFLQTQSLASMSNKEAEMRVYYAYKIIASLQDSELDGDLFQLFLAFATRLGKKGRLRDVLTAYLLQLMQSGKLHLIADDNQDEWKFGNASKLTRNFLEDEDAADTFSVYNPKDNFYADVMRIVFVGGKEFFLRLFEYVFFTDSEEIPFKKVAVAQKLKTEILGIDITEFLVESKMLSKAQALFLQLLYRFCTTKAFYDCINAAPTPLDVAKRLGMTNQQIEEVCESQSIGLLGNFLDFDFDLERIAYTCLSIRSLRPYFNNVSRALSTNRLKQTRLSISPRKCWDSKIKTSLTWQSLSIEIPLKK